jgi:hypothetical protein
VAATQWLIQCLHRVSIPPLCLGVYCLKPEGASLEEIDMADNPHSTDDADMLGSEPGGTDIIGPEAGGTDELGPEAGGTDELGPEAGGTDELGPEAGGTDMLRG